MNTCKTRYCCYLLHNSLSLVICHTLSTGVLAFYNLHWQCNHSLPLFACSRYLDHNPYLQSLITCQCVTVHTTTLATERSKQIWFKVITHFDPFHAASKITDLQVLCFASVYSVIISAKNCIKPSLNSKLCATKH